jgi:hypothetical protein
LFKSHNLKANISAYALFRAENPGVAQRHRSFLAFEMEQPIVASEYKDRARRLMHEEALKALEASEREDILSKQWQKDVMKKKNGWFQKAWFWLMADREWQKLRESNEPHTVAPSKVHVL